jgi:dethiobiotin synthetase
MARLTILVSGTDTEVGKTWLGARLLESLRLSGAEVHARKPVQSFDRTDALTDAEILGRASGESPDEVTPEHRWYPVAMAPPMAADALEQPEIKMQDLVSETLMPKDGVCLVEGVGGPRSPLAHNGDSVSLARALVADLVVIVSPAELGAINSVMLSVGAFSPLRTVVFLNRFDPLNDLHVRNRAWLENRCGRSVMTEVDELSLVVSRMLTEHSPQLG